MIQLYAEVSQPSLAQRLLSHFFPATLPKAFSPADMTQVLEYQYRISRTGTEPKPDQISAARIKRVEQGEYVYADQKPTSLHYSDDERQRVAIYPVKPRRRDLVLECVG